MKHLWSTSDLAGAFGRTPRRITQLVKEGVLPKPQNGQYDAVKTVKAFVKYLEIRVSNTSLEAERTRLTKLKADRAQHDLAVVKGQYLPVDEVKVAAFNKGRTVRDGLLNIPNRVSSVLAAESDPLKVSQVLEKEIRQALEELSGSAPS